MLIYSYVYGNELPHVYQFPPNPKGHAFQHAMDKALEEAQNQQQALAHNPTPPINAAELDEEISDVNFDIEEVIDLCDAPNPPECLEDNLDLFQMDDNSRSCTNFEDLSVQLTYLLIIYMMMTWLHLQWHLPCAACNAVLSILSCLVFALCPTLLALFVTLPSAMKVHSTCKIPLFLPDQTKHGLLHSKKIPCVKYPYLPLSDQIQSILTIPGVEDHYSDIFDGDICQTKLKALDGSLFFANGPQDSHGPNGELQISITLGIDCILPGPKEQNLDKIQHFLRPIVSDLLFPTPSCPDGHLVCIVLVAIVCNKPAAHKLAEKDKAKAFQWELREHYCQLTTAAAHKNFVKDFVTRFTQLSCLPYFNLMNQIVINLMHNLFLGLIKTQFYNIWVQGKILHPNHELWVFHDLLADFEIPTSCEKLPTDIGIPAGGSLTADQWLLLATVYGPIAIPHLWNVCLSDAQQYGFLTNCVTMIAKQESEKLKGKPSNPALGTLINGTPGESVTETDETDGKCILHPNDPANFLKLYAVICLLIKKTITDEEISSVNALLREYCMELIQLYGSSCLKPNHHYATHTSRYVQNFGPLSGFWMFLFKCLNKILKSFKTNNHSNRELETTFFNEFHKTCQSSRLIFSLQQMPDQSLGHKVSDIMVKASAEEWGTVVGLAALLKDLNEAHSEAVSHCIALNCTTMFFDYMIVDGKKYHASHAMGPRNSSLIHVVIPQKDGQPLVNAFGEILEIFRFDQDIQYQGQSMYFVHMQ
ncbi:hypothetical protein V8B97DRAFT_2023066 [Scleroderma yunnanense]